MSAERQKFKGAAQACLGQDRPVGDLTECVSTHFPDVEVFRENDDLVIKGGHRFLVVRRAGPDKFRVSENVSVPSTNVVDAGGGTARTLDELVDEIAALAK